MRHPALPLPSRFDLESYFLAFLRDIEVMLSDVGQTFAVMPIVQLLCSRMSNGVYRGEIGEGVMPG